MTMKSRHLGEVFTYFKLTHDGVARCLKPFLRLRQLSMFIKTTTFGRLGTFPYSGKTDVKDNPL
jgi:hypothetical protein